MGDMGSGRIFHGLRKVSKYYSPSYYFSEKSGNLKSEKTIQDAVVLVMLLFVLWE